MRRGRGRPHSCGNCGYLTIGLPSSICPECGADLRVVGDRGPVWWSGVHMRERARAIVIIWTLWCVVLLTLVGGLVEIYDAPALRTYPESATFITASGKYNVTFGRLWGRNERVDSPLLARFASPPLLWRVAVSREPWHLYPEAVSMTPRALNSPWAGPQLIVDRASSTVSWNAPGDMILAQPIGPLNGALEAWAGAWAEELGDPGFPAEVQRICAAGHAARPGSLRDLRLAGMEWIAGSHWRTLDWEPVVLTAVVWLGGLGALGGVLLRHRRLSVRRAA
jgi:hypothetical protein